MLESKCRGTVTWYARMVQAPVIPIGGITRKQPGGPVEWRTRPARDLIAEAYARTAFHKFNGRMQKRSQVHLSSQFILQHERVGSSNALFVGALFRRCSERSTPIPEHNGSRNLFASHPEWKCHGTIKALAPAQHMRVCVATAEPKTPHYTLKPANLPE